MNKIELLLHTLAPKGVEFRKLGDIILSLKTGLNPRKFFKLNTPNANNYYVTVRELEEHTIKFTHQTDRIDDNALSLCLKRSNLEKDDILFSGTGTIGKVSIIKENPNNWAIKEGIYSIKPNNKIVFPRFLMFCFENLNIQNDIKSKSFGGTVKSISMNDLQQITIPIPPLEIQQEIVKILDAFTELNTELNTELKARKKQYEYYQNMLLDFKDINQNHKDAKIKSYPKRLKTLLQTLAPKGVEFKKIGELFKRNKGINITAAQMKELHSDIGKIRIFAGGATKADINYKDISKKDIINCESVIIKSRGNIGFEYYNQPFSHKNEIWSYSSKTNQMLVKFLYYYLSNNQDYFQKLAQSSSVKLPQLSVSDTDEYEVPIPPLEIQQEIVTILDQFSALTTDLQAGIPAEIKARKKQYEYYREKLLTFKPLTPNKEVDKE
ncbi:restriction endonuclease subunit S [Helicobacter pylori]|uniref:restriction endonuclease subunit S n=1 Tax=Helicobacter pylori TaxID=210 RepID=UPI00026A5DB2|nr:restriction endonuclease subunit S [Helicobacter pylori]EJB48474.1 type I restriction enzyme, S subunit [Helicobacter pylori Hp H-16]